MFSSDRLTEKKSDTRLGHKTQTVMRIDVPDSCSCRASDGFGAMVKRASGAMLNH
jgi:hypothetical protein